MATALDDQLQLMQSEEDVDARRVLLLWFIRNALGVEELDAYEYVFDEPKQSIALRVDAAFVSDAEEPGRESGILNLVEIKEGDPAAIITSLRDTSSRFLQATSTETGRRELIDAIRGSIAIPRKLDVSKLRPRLHLVTRAPGAGGGEIEAASGEVLVYDRDHLERLARAIASPTAVQTTIVVNAHPDEILEAQIPAGAVITCPVRATQIVDWPGISDRSLFDLNVRFELGSGRVRRSLDMAIANPAQHPNFLAFHNGLTVVCDRVRITTFGLEVENISVVNGAQSVIAFERHRHELTDDLKVLVKFTAVGTNSSVAREIAIRSNTQNPVNSRNLRALDPIQLSIAQEFEETYPGYVYVLRPDVGADFGGVAIANDEAAQLLCAIYNERPWLAVKRLSLFEPPNYQAIFSHQIRAAHIILAHRLHQRVLTHRQDVPVQYREAWKLTALVMTYLAGQALRTTDDTKALLDQPDRALSDPSLDEILDHAARSAVVVLRERSEALERADEPDDYKVDFKRETALRELGSRIRKVGMEPASGAWS